MLPVAAAAVIAQPAAAVVHYSSYDPSDTPAYEHQYWLPLTQRAPDANQTFDNPAYMGGFWNGTVGNNYAITTQFVAPTSFAAHSIILPVRMEQSFGNFRIFIALSQLDQGTGQWLGLGSTQIESGLLGFGYTAEVQLPFGVSGARYVDYAYNPVNVVAGETYRIEALWSAGAYGGFRWYLSDTAAAPGQSIQYTEAPTRAIGGKANPLAFVPAFALTDGGDLSRAPANPGASPGAVPEPATWATMILGFGVIGGAMRATRRRRLSITFG